MADAFDALSDDPVSVVLAARCRRLLDGSGPSGFDGAWMMDDK